MAGDDAASPLSEDELRYTLWWQILRPDRLRIADEIDRVAGRYRRADAHREADALDGIASWLRAAAGEVDDKPDRSLDAIRRLVEATQ